MDLKVFCSFCLSRCLFTCSGRHNGKCWCHHFITSHRSVWNSHSWPNLLTVYCSHDSSQCYSITEGYCCYFAAKNSCWNRTSSLWGICYGMLLFLVKQIFRLSVKKDNVLFVWFFCFFSIYFLFSIYFFWGVGVGGCQCVCMCVCMQGLKTIYCHLKSNRGNLLYTGFQIRESCPGAALQKNSPSTLALAYD